MDQPHSLNFARTTDYREQITSLYKINIIQGNMSIFIERIPKGKHEERMDKITGKHRVEKEKEKSFEKKLRTIERRMRGRHDDFHILITLSLIILEIPSLFFSGGLID